MKNLDSDSDRLAIAARVRALRRDSPRQWGRMTPHQMLCHLNDSFLAALGRRNVSPAGGLFQRTVMKWGGLWVSIPWPKGIPTRPEVEQGVRGTPPVDFELDRRQLLHLVDEFTRPATDLSAHHPLFGAMSRKEWMRWGWLHMDHHLRQFGA